MVKKCLKSWIYWLLISIIILFACFYYDYATDFYSEIFEGFMIFLLMISNIICFANLSHKNGIKRLLTITIISFSVSLFLIITFHEDFLYSDIWGMISLISLLFVFIPAGTLTLLKLVWRDKSEDEIKNKDDNEDKKLIKTTRRKINKNR